MPSAIDTGRVLAAIDERRLLELERNTIRIPSSTFEEGKIADFYANYIVRARPRRRDDGGRPPARARQSRAASRSDGWPAPAAGRASCSTATWTPACEMSGWSVDPYGAKFEDGWMWGMGAHDDKGGLAAAICGGGGHRPVRRPAARRRDRHARWWRTSSAAPGRARCSSMGLRPTSASTWSIPTTPSPTSASASSWCGSPARRPSCSSATARGAAAVHEPDRAAGRDRPAHRAEPRADPARRLDALHAAPRAAGVPDAHLRHHPQGALLPEELHGHVEPRMRDGLPAPHRARPDRWQSVRDDLTRLLAGIKRDHPAFDCEMTIPAKGMEERWNQSPMECRAGPSPRHRARRRPALASGTPAWWAARGRLGNVGDGNIIQERSASRPCSTARATSASTRNGRRPTSACCSPTW